METKSRAFDIGHPLLADRARLDKILDLMYAKIQKTLFNGARGSRPRVVSGQYIDSGGRDLTLVGSGISADDVLNEALAALLQFRPSDLRGSWEALAVKIAGNKAKDALRATNKGLRSTDQRQKMIVVSGDVDRFGPDGKRMPTPLEELRSVIGNPEAEVLTLEAVEQLLNLARTVLEGREQEIFFAIHFQNQKRNLIGNRLGLTGQRVGQIYKETLRRLESHPEYPDEFRKQDLGGNQ